MSNRKPLIMMLVLMMFLAGCGTKQGQDTKAPDKAQVGIIDMNKAVKGHAKYSQLMELEKQADSLEAQLAAQQSARQGGLSQANPGSDMAELNKTSEQEFNAKMSAKQDELNGKLNTKADAIERSLSDELNAYNDQLEKEYQPKLFNLQLKLKTVQLGKEETASIQAELDKLNEQRSAALAAKHTELTAKMNGLMAPEKDALEQQLTAYAKQLNEEIAKQAGDKQAEFITRMNEQNKASAQLDATSNGIAEQLNNKHQEIEALQGYIITNIKDKTAKIAVEKGYEAVLTNVAVNVSAIDITDAVIAECNK